MTPTQPFDFDLQVDRRGTASLKWEKYRGRDVIPLWVADMDFRSPPEVIAALHRRVDHGIFGYAVPPGELVETVVGMMARQYGWEVSPDWLVWLPGLVTGLNVACRAVGEDGDAVATLVPVYPPFLSAPPLSRRQLIKIPLAETGNRWRIDWAGLETALTGRTRLLLWCNPHNPVGRVFSRKELEAVAALCVERNLVVCSDEIHCDLVLEKGMRHIPLAMISEEAAARSITLMAPSKTFNLPGLGCSFAVIPCSDLRRRFKHAMAGIVPLVNALGFEAALAAYRNGDGWRRALVEYLRGNRECVRRAVERMPPLTMAPVEATYLAWIDVRRSGLSDAVAFFENAGVGLQEGAEFDGPGFVRLNFGCPRAVLDEALERMVAAMSARVPIQQVDGGI